MDREEKEKRTIQIQIKIKKKRKRQIKTQRKKRDRYTDREETTHDDAGENGNTEQTDAMSAPATMNRET